MSEEYDPWTRKCLPTANE